MNSVYPCRFLTWSAVVIANGIFLFSSAAAPCSRNPLDVVIAGHEGFQVWFGGGNGRFESSEQGFIPLPSATGVASGDLDGDGDLDLFVTRYERESSQVWFNEGKGHFRSGHALPPADYWRVALGDLDADGDLDAVLGGTTSYKTPEAHPDEVWLNDGKGGFSVTRQRLGEKGTAQVVLIDFDGDRDLDAVTVGAGGARIWLNDGNAVFQESRRRIGRADATSGDIAFGDLDGDGDLDALLANLRNEVWLAQGKGEFALGQVFERSLETFALALGDLDGDGDLDAYFGNSTKGQPNEVWFNNGKGRFVDSGQRLGADVTLDVVLADFDGDGDLDVIEANRASPNRLRLNDGKGRFSDSGQELGNWKSRNIAVGILH